MKTFTLSNQDARKLLNLLNHVHELSKESVRPKDRNKGRESNRLKKKLIKQI